VEKANWPGPISQHTFKKLVMLLKKSVPEAIFLARLCDPHRRNMAGIVQ